MLFVTSEYNRSIPAALKNALDVGSRPYGKSVAATREGHVVPLTRGVTLGSVSMTSYGAGVDALPLTRNETAAGIPNQVPPEQTNI